MVDPQVPKPPEGNWGWIGWIFAGIIAGIQALFHRRKRNTAPEMAEGEELTDTLDRLYALEEKYRIHDGHLLHLRGAVENLAADMVTKQDLRDFERRLIQNLRQT